MLNKQKHLSVCKYLLHILKVFIHEQKQCPAKVLVCVWVDLLHVKTLCAYKCICVLCYSGRSLIQLVPLLCPCSLKLFRSLSTIYMSYFNFFLPVWHVKFTTNSVPLQSVLARLMGQCCVCRECNSLNQTTFPNYFHQIFPPVFC